MSVQAASVQANAVVQYGYSFHGIPMFLVIRTSIPPKHQLPTIPESKGRENLYLYHRHSFPIILVSLAAYDKTAD